MRKKQTYEEGGKAVFVWLVEGFFLMNKLGYLTEKQKRNASEKGKKHTGMK